MLLLVIDNGVTHPSVSKLKFNEIKIRNEIL